MDRQLQRAPGNTVPRNQRSKKTSTLRDFVLRPLTAAVLTLALALGGCGGEEGDPPHPDCPKHPATSATVCPPELLQKVCWWDDSEAKVRTWCKCPAGNRWYCFDEPLTP